MIVIGAEEEVAEVTKRAKMRGCRGGFRVAKKRGEVMIVYCNRGAGARNYGTFYKVPIVPRNRIKFWSSGTIQNLAKSSS